MLPPCLLYVCFGCFFLFLKKVVANKITVRIVVKIIYKKNKMRKKKGKLRWNTLLTTNKSSFIILFIFNISQLLSLNKISFGTWPAKTIKKLISFIQLNPFISVCLTYNIALYCVTTVQSICSKMRLQQSVKLLGIWLLIFLQLPCGRFSSPAHAKAESRPQHAESCE